VFRLLGGLAFFGVVAFAAIPASADPPTPESPAGQALGIVPVHSQAHNGASSGGNLLYHSGGSVQLGTHNTYAIYWGAANSFNSGYQTVINQYFTDVAADSGKSTNVYYSDTQYYQGTTANSISYSEHFAGSFADTSSAIPKGCNSTAGGTVGCVTDAQIQAEVAHVISANHLPTGTTNEYFVFLGKGISTCSGSSCFVSQFCAYHSHYGSGTGTVLYANMPYTGYSPSACGSGVTPNGNSDADSTLNVTSHEANETITDELGNAWFDRRGYENGDKCAWNFGTGGQYNQTINGHHYYLQGEWSNKSSGCVWSGT
jgi:hypothetical protein